MTIVNTHSYDVESLRVDKTTMFCNFTLKRNRNHSSSFVLNRGWSFFVFHVPFAQNVRIFDRSRAVQLDYGSWGCFIPAREPICWTTGPGIFYLSTLTSNEEPPKQFSKGIRIIPYSRLYSPLKSIEIMDLLRHYQSSDYPCSTDLKIENAKSLIESNLKTDVSIAEIAGDLRISREHLSRYFASFFGVSPKQYLQSLRMNEFMKLIQFEERSITEACFESGFNDLSSLIRAFKTDYGASPSHFCFGG